MSTPWLLEEKEEEKKKYKAKLQNYTQKENSEERGLERGLGCCLTGGKKLNEFDQIDQFHG